MIAPVKTPPDYYPSCRMAEDRIREQAATQAEARGCRLVLAALARTANRKGKASFEVSARDISELALYSPRQVYEVMTALEGMGVIKIEASAGKAFRVLMLMGYVETRRGKLAVQESSQPEPAPARESEPRERPARIRRQRDNTSAEVAEVAEEPYRTIIERLEATGFIRLRQRDIIQAAEVAPVKKLESEYLLDWLVEQITERVRYPAEWLSARFREWQAVGSDFTRDRIEQKQRHEYLEYIDKVCRLLEGIDVRGWDELELQFASEGIRVPLEHPKFSEAARLVAERYSAEHQRQITIGQLFDDLCVARFNTNVQTGCSEWRAFDNPIWREVDSGAVFFSESEPASK